MSNTTINNAALDIFGNLTGVNANVTTLRATGQINAVGNVVAPFFIGNGSLLTGVAATPTTKPVFSMFASNNQSLLATSNIVGSNIAYGNVLFDPRSACNVITGSFTAPQSGYYKFITNTSFSGLAANGNRAFIELRLVKNTTEPIAILNGIFCPWTFGGVGSRVTYSADALVNLTAGDIINVRGFNNANITQTIFGNSSNMFTRFYGFYVGA